MDTYINLQFVSHPCFSSISTRLGYPSTDATMRLVKPCAFLASTAWAFPAMITPVLVHLCRSEEKFNGQCVGQ